jgi:hypothetical protein
MSFESTHNLFCISKKKTAKRMDKFVVRMKSGDSSQRFNVSTSPSFFFFFFFLPTLIFFLNRFALKLLLLVSSYTNGAESSGRRERPIRLDGKSFYPEMSHSDRDSAN